MNQPHRPRWFPWFPWFPWSGRDVQDRRGRLRSRRSHGHEAIDLDRLGVAVAGAAERMWL